MEKVDLLESTIAEIQAALARGVLTSCELVAACHARVARYDREGPELNAVATLNPDALNDARALDDERRAEGARGPLHGIPIIIKDNYCTAGLQTTGGSKALAGWRPNRGAFLVERLRQAGAIVLGKSNMHEFACGWENIGSLFGQSRSPYSLERSPGGSSGGSAVAVAASLAVAALGTDTCGSVRLPASFNNVVGLRPTQGLLSRSGIIPLSHTHDIAGPLTRCVSDLAVILDALVGYDPGDPQTSESRDQATGGYASHLTRGSLEGKRLGYPKEVATPDDDPNVIRVFEAALRDLEREGAHVVAVTIPQWTELFSVAKPLATFASQFKFDLASFLIDQGAPIRSLEELLSTGKVSPHPSVEARLRSLLAIQEANPAARAAEVSRMRAGATVIETLLSDHGLSALVYPTSSRPAAMRGEQQSGSGTNCQLAPCSGTPAITVPAGFTDDGFPVGLELLGARWSEATLIRLSYAYEQATRHRRLPPTTPPLSPPQSATSK